MTRGIAKESKRLFKRVRLGLGETTDKLLQSMLVLHANLSGLSGLDQ
jgi:hypothetical protein